MGTISPAQSADGETIEAADINNPINTIANEFNGNIEAVNLASNSVTTAKIADDAVTGAKIGSYVLERQDDDADSIANTTKTDVVIQMGWGQKDPGSTTNTWTEAVTFPTAFTSDPMVIISGLAKKNSVWADIGDGGASDGVWHATAQAITTTGFTATARMETGVNFVDTRYYAYSWIAIGPV